MTTTRIFTFTILITLFSQCDERVDRKTMLGGMFTRSVGGPISRELAAQWIERERSHSSGREQNFSVSAEHLNQVLARTS